MQIYREVDMAYMMSTSYLQNILQLKVKIMQFKLPLLIEQVNFVSVIEPEIT